MVLRSLFLAVCLACVPVASADDPPFTVSKISDKQAGLEATVFTFGPEQNVGFGILDVPNKVEADNIAMRFDAKRHSLMINGGYFDLQFEPDCYCKIDGRVLNAKEDPKRSGFVAIDKAGKISLLARGETYSKFPSVLQSGPYVIDPGGKVGIRSKSGRRARRTLIGMTTDGRLVILITEPIYLVDLANAVKKSLPKLERLLNLDGGPSTGVIARGVKVVNRMPVRNYLYKKAGK